MDPPLQAVKHFWEQAACGEGLYLAGTDREHYDRQARRRYQLEPYISLFAEFQRYAGKTVLEIGVGLGADHQRFAEAGVQLSGIDLTERAVRHVQRRFQCLGLRSNLMVANAEALPLPGASFDLVYCWGVLHHSPDPQRALAEIHRVLKPGGEFKGMIYHKHSLVGYALWLRYGLLRMRPWLPLREIYSRHLESPGTKAYSLREVRELFHDFQDLEIQVHLTHGDLLESAAGQRHRGILLFLARHLWPRPLIRLFLKKHGLFLTVKARKGAARGVAGGRACC